jgi:hypothetical protein
VIGNTGYFLPGNFPVFNNLLKTEINMKRALKQGVKLKDHVHSEFHATTIRKIKINA